MIGKEEWNEMAKQVVNLEKQMESFYGKLAGKINDPELKDFFTRLSNDERQHSARIKILIDNMLKL